MICVKDNAYFLQLIHRNAICVSQLVIVFGMLLKSMFCSNISFLASKNLRRFRTFSETLLNGILCSLLIFDTATEFSLIFGEFFLQLFSCNYYNSFLSDHYLSLCLVMILVQTISSNE